MRRALLCAACLAALAAASSAAGLEVGAAAAPVSPDAGAYLAGYDRDRRAEGTHDDVFAKAVVIRDGGETLAIVVVDCIGLLHPDVERIRRRAAELIGEGALAPGHIVVTSTHTHSGPDVAGLWGRFFFTSGRDEAYVDRLVETAARQVAAAARSLAPATMRVGSGRARFSWVENVSEPGLLDDHFTVVQFVSLADPRRSIATLTNFPCHPTVLGPENHLVSADYVGGFYGAMDSALGGVNVFLQGAIGGWVQPRQDDRSFATAREYGELVAAVSRALLREAEPVPRPEVRFASTTVDIPLDNWGFRLLMLLGVLDRELIDGRIRTEVAWFAIGGVQFATHPGETSPAYSLATRELMGNPRHSMILGLGLDALGYILKPVYFADDAQFPHAGYLTSVSVGPEAAPLVMRALATLVPPTEL